MPTGANVFWEFLATENDTEKNVGKRGVTVSEALAPTLPGTYLKFSRWRSLEVLHDTCVVFFLIFF